MGESNRRKLLDPNYGKPLNIPLSLGVKTTEFNGYVRYTVFCNYCGFEIDSCENPNNAALLKDAIEKAIKDKPIKGYTEKHWDNWIDVNVDSIPCFDVEDEVREYLVDYYGCTQDFEEAINLVEKKLKTDKYYSSVFIDLTIKRLRLLKPQIDEMLDEINDEY